MRSAKTVLFVLKNRQIGHGPEWEYLTLNWRGDTLGTFEMTPETAAAEFERLESIAPARLLHLWNEGAEYDKALGVQRFGRFNVRVLKKGERYGLRDCLTHEDARPVIEFYDSRYAGPAHGERGQFVSRYYFETLAARMIRQPGAGLCLEGGVPDWTINGAEFAEAMQYAATHITC